MGISDRMSQRIGYSLMKCIKRVYQFLSHIENQRGITSFLLSGKEVK